MPFLGFSSFHVIFVTNNCLLFNIFQCNRPGAGGQAPPPPEWRLIPLDEVRAPVIRWLYFEKLQVRWQVAAGGAMKALLPPALFNSTVKFREWWMEVFWINFLFVLQFLKIVAWLKFSGLQCIVKQLKWDKWCSGSRVPDYLLMSDEIIEINLYRITGTVLDSESLINFVLQQPQDKYV